MFVQSTYPINEHIIDVFIDSISIGVTIVGSRREGKTELTSDSFIHRMVIVSRVTKI